MINYEVKKILVPLDGSQNSFRGLEKAIYFAKKCNSSITGLCVAYVPPKFGFETIENIDSVTRKKIDDFMIKSKKLAEENGINFHNEIIHGKPENDILVYANKWNFDLIVMGSRGAGSKDESFIGSVANHILHKTQIPIIIVK